MRVAAVIPGRDIPLPRIRERGSGIRERESGSANRGSENGDRGSGDDGGSDAFLGIPQGRLGA